MLTLFFISLFTLTSNTKYTTTKYNSMLHGYDIVLHFKDNKKVENFEIDLKNQINYFIKEQTSSNLLHTLNYISDKTININNKSHTVKEFSSSVRLYQSDDKAMLFFLYQIDNLDYNTLSLSFTFHDIKQSLIHQLFYNNNISYKSFTFITSQYQSDKIYFGKFPFEYLTKSAYKGHCRVVPSHSSLG